MLPYPVYEKVILSGTDLEHYKYEKPYWVGYPQMRSLRPHFKREKGVLEQEEILERNVKRSRQKIRRLVNSNQDLVKFMTLTFNTEVVELEVGNKIFNKFIKRITALSPGFKYLCVPEFQPESGRVHYHLLCNLPFIENKHLEKIWGQGFVFIRKIDSVNNLGSYICKYLGKLNFDKRLFHKKKFFYSVNLIKPLILDHIEDVKLLFSKIPFSVGSFVKKVFTTFFCSDYLGNMEYTNWRLSSDLDVGF